MKRAVIFVVVFVLLAGLIGGFSYFQFVLKPAMIRQAIFGHAPPPTAVAAEPARTETWQPRLPAIGTLVSVQGINVAPEQSGVVRAVHFDSGQDIAKGAPMVEIDDSVEQADLKSTQATLRDSQLELARQNKLLAAGNTAKTTYDTAVAKRDIAAANVERNRAVIAQKAVTAPFSGRLGIRRVDVGQFVAPGTQMVSLQQLDPIYVDFPLPEQSLALVQIGQTVELRLDAFPGVSFTGTVASIDARINENTRTVLVRGQLANPDHRLLPGMFANVTVQAGTPGEVVTVPRTAVSYSLYGDNVFVVETGKRAPGADATAPPPQMAVRRFVKTGDVRGDRVAISEGVKDGELVITEGQLKLQSGMHVTVAAAATLTPPAVLPKE